MKKIALMYHDVYLKSPNESGFVSKGANRYKMPDSLFREHLQLIKEMAHDTVLTFDDGGDTFLTVISPLLEEYGFKGHFYIATDYIDTDGFLSTTQVKELAQRGHFIGAHSCSHPQNMDDLVYDQRKAEWQKSINKLSDILGLPVTEVSIPNGYYKHEDIQMLSNLGIKNIYTSYIVDNNELDGTCVIGRIAVNCETTAEDLKYMLTSRVTFAKLLAKQYLLSFFKMLFGKNYLFIKRLIRRVVP